jgi:hypothetical protein
MKKYIYLVIIFFASLSITGCKKDLIEEPQTDESPVFKIEGELGQESFTACAGDDGFLMSTFIKQVNGVDFFAGSISNGDVEFEMGFFNGNLDMTSSSLTNELAEDIFFANQPVAPLLSISKDDFPNSSLISSINWSLNGIVVAQDNLVISEPGRYLVGAKVNFFDGTNATIENELIVGYHRNVFSQLRHFMGQNGHLKAWIDENTSEVQAIKWYLDGQLVSNELIFNTIVTPYGHKITAIIDFENGTHRTKTIWVDGSSQGKFIDDISSFESLSSAVEWDYKSKISFKYKGQTYSSISVNNQSSTFEVLGIQHYSTSSQGKPIYKIIANINCMMKNTISNEVLPFNALTTFAIEIK